MEGGPSHLDLFDPKPLLTRLAGQRVPSTFRRVITSMGEFESPLLASRRKWRQHGQCGTWVSDWLPHTAECVDDIAVIRSCWCDAINHSAGVCQMNTGSTLAGRPSLGSWACYGLGTENQNLPAFVVLQDGAGTVVNGPRNWGAGFMPAVYQGIRFQNGAVPIPNLHPPEGISQEQQRGRLDFLTQLNRRHAQARPQQTELDARIASYELAFRMQSEAPDAVDLVHESPATQRLYGIDQRPTASFGRTCLLRRRLVERGVRFVQLYHGAGSKWDAHSKLESNHADLCRASDLPVAGLLKDLKQRGLLETTLVVWGGEFGRTPMSEKGDGRDHNPDGFTMWMAGGGVQGGALSARPTSWVSMPSRTGCTSTTCTRPFCTSWASTTCAWSIGTRAGPSDRPSTRAKHIGGSRRRKGKPTRLAAGAYATYSLGGGGIGAGAGAGAG